MASKLSQEGRFVYFVVDMLFKTNGRICFFERKKGTFVMKYKDMYCHEPFEINNVYNNP